MEIMAFDIDSNSMVEYIEKYDDSNFRTALVIFKKEALTILSSFYYICGYLMFDKKSQSPFPFDLHNQNIAIYECHFQNMDMDLQKALYPYICNSIDLRNPMSQFFYLWQIEGCFQKDYNPFINLCYSILTTKHRSDLFFKTDQMIYCPSSYSELCLIVKNILLISNINIIELDYSKELKYLIDGLKKGYHINLTNKELKSHFQNICQIVNERWN